jgi:uncharacterized membrane protein YhdT
VSRLTAYGAGLLAMAVLLAADLAGGPMGADDIDYGISESMWNQLLGLELVTLFLVLPWTVVAAVLALRGHAAAPLLGFAPSAYTTYMYAQYVLGPQYDSYRPVVLLELALTSTGLLLTLWSWSLARALPAPSTTPRRQRALGLVLLGLAGFVVLRYLPGLVDTVGQAPIPTEFSDAPTFYWSIVLLDLGVVVPLTVAAGVAALRGTPAGVRAPYAVLGWFALVPPSVFAMAAVMLARDDPNASVPTTVLLGVASLVFGVAAALVLRRLFATSGRGTPPAGTEDPARPLSVAAESETS